MRRAPNQKRKEKSLSLPEGESYPEVLCQEEFLWRLRIEKKRTERSRSRFILMLLESTGLLSNGQRRDTAERILKAIARSTRETDVTGWYKDGAIIGTIFAEIGTEEGHSVANVLLSKFTRALSATFSVDEVNEISLSFHVFPDDWEGDGDGPSAIGGFSGLDGNSAPKKGTLWIKKAMGYRR